MPCVLTRVLLNSFRGPVPELRADFPEVDFAGLAPHEADPYWTEAREPWADIVQRAVQLLQLIMSRCGV